MFASLGLKKMPAASHIKTMILLYFTYIFKDIYTPKNSQCRSGTALEEIEKTNDTGVARK